MTRSLWMHLYQAVMAIAVLIAIGLLEPLYFPVVREWTVTKMDRFQDTVVLSGYMKKVRDCKFVGMVAEDDDGHRLPLKYLDNPIDDTASRPVGAQTWGPWQVVVNIQNATSRVRFTATHSCHIGWQTVTHLGEVKLFPGVNQ